jgi:hypothetical protein
VGTFLPMNRAHVSGRDVAKRSSVTREFLNDDVAI